MDDARRLIGEDIELVDRLEPPAGSVRPTRARSSRW